MLKRLFLFEVRYPPLITVIFAVGVHIKWSTTDYNTSFILMGKERISDLIIKEWSELINNHMQHD